jgi:hypothetical protein
MRQQARLPDRKLYVSWFFINLSSQLRENLPKIGSSRWIRAFATGAKPVIVASFQLLPGKTASRLR